MFASEVIYKADSNGGIRTWQYEADADKWRTIAGGPGRKPVTSGWSTCKGKQGRSDVEQAQFEANASRDQKLAREYRRTVPELSSVPKSPMLAHKYDDHKAGIANLFAMKRQVFCQPKLDGIRALISEHGAFSREYQPHLNVEHITEALAPAFKANPGIVFDGELYNHELREDFGKIASIVRKQKPTPDQRAEALKLIQYHIYDIADDTLPFADRAHFLAEQGSLPGKPNCIVFVNTQKVTEQDTLDGQYGLFLEDGYEGQMVRLNTPYEFDKRSKSLLKRKEFITAEFKLLSIEEGNGNWAGMAKRVVFELPDGRECGAGIRGTQERARELIEPPNNYHDGSLVTIRHFTPTPDGMPRFPVAIDFHFGGRKD